MVTDLQSLIERVERATGPDRDLDLDILDALCAAKQHRSYWDWHAARPKGTAERPTREFWINPSRYLALTGSIDAVLVLVNALMPDCNGSIIFGEPYVNPFARLAPLQDGDRRFAEAYGATITLAILLALLRAMQAREEVQA